MTNTTVMKLAVIPIVVLFLFSCKESTVITDINSEIELQLILNPIEEDIENEISDVFDNAEKTNDVKTEEIDISNVGKQEVEKEEANKAQPDMQKTETAAIPENNENQDKQVTQEASENQMIEESKELKPYNGLYVVINGIQEYHRQTCQKLADTAIQHQNFYTSAKELYFNGFIPCDVCKPNN